MLKRKVLKQIMEYKEHEIYVPRKIVEEKILEADASKWAEVYE